MNRIRMGTIGVLVAVAIGAAVFAVRQSSTARQTETRFVGLTKRQADTSAQIAALEDRVREQAKRAATIETDNARLRDALVRTQTAQAAQAAVVAKPMAPITRQALEERFKSARQLGRSGDPAEALRELLWCWDVGLKQGNPATAPIWRGRLMEGWRDLAQRYPPAREELQRRSDALRERILASPGGGDLVPDYMSVLGALGEETAVLGLLDQIPAGDPRRRDLTIYASEQLLDARRYTEAMESKSSGTMFSRFEMNARLGVLSRPDPDGGPNASVTSIARDIEVLAGSGNLADARELAKRLLAFDSSESMRALIQKHAERAGRPDLLSPRAP